MAETLSRKIKSRFSALDGKRQQVLDRAIKCAALSMPWLLTPTSQQETGKLPETYQSVASRGIVNLAGKAMIALFPPDHPWFGVGPSPEIEFDPGIDPERLQEVKDGLFLEEMKIAALLESTSASDNQRRKSGWYTTNRQAILQTLVTGDVLERLRPDFRLQVFRRDSYVTVRDSSGDVLFYITKEKIDPLSLESTQIGMANLDQRELEEKEIDARMEELYTLIEWQPQKKTWVIAQEVNDNNIFTAEEEVCPYFSTPYELAPGEAYGRGLIELNFGDLSSLNEAEEKMLDFMAMASKMLPAVDFNSMVREEDLTKPSGEMIRCRVEGGKVQDVALLSLTSFPDFRVVDETIKRKTKALGAAMLLESEVQPQGERVTRYQVQRVAMEVDAATGGLYASMADNRQLSIVKRAMVEAKRKGLIAPIAEKDLSITILTGLNTFQREAASQRLMTFTQLVSQLGPTAMQRIDMATLMKVYARYQSIHEPGLIKTDEMLAQEQQQNIQASAQNAAAQKTVETLGNVAEAALMPQ